MTWSRWVKGGGTAAVAVGMMALTKSPLADFRAFMYGAAAAQSQMGDVFGAIGGFFDRARERYKTQASEVVEDGALIRDRAGHVDAQRTVAAGEPKENQAERQRQREVRADRADAEADTGLRSREDDRARHLEELRQEQRLIIGEINSAALKDEFQDVDALLPRLAQVRAEHRRLEAMPEPADPSRESTARGEGLPETEEQDASPKSERADGPDGGPSHEAEQATDAREGSTPSAAEVGDANARGAAVRRAEPDGPSSESGGRGDAGLEAQGDESHRHDADSTQQPETEREPTAGEGAHQTPTREQVRGPEAPPGGPAQPPETEPDARGGDGAEEMPTGDPSAERSPHEAGSPSEPPTPEPISEPSRERWLPATRYLGSGVSTEQLQAMKGPAPRFDPPESVTDAASRKQAALAAMTSDRPARQKPSERTSAQAGQADHPEPSEGAAPPQPAPDREMD